MQAGNAGLNLSKQRVNIDVATTRTRCAHGHHHKHVPALPQHAVLQVNCATTAASAAAAAAASMHRLLEHSSEPEIVQEQSFEHRRQHRSSSGSSRSNCTGNGHSISSIRSCPTQQGAQQQQLHRTTAAAIAAQAQAADAHSNIVYRPPVSRYIVTSNGRSPASISNSQTSQDELTVQATAYSTQHSPALPQQPEYEQVDQAQEHLLLHHVQQDCRQIDGIVRSMVQEVLLQDQHSSSVAGQSVAAAVAASSTAVSVDHSASVDRHTGSLQQQDMYQQWQQLDPQAQLQQQEVNPPQQLASSTHDVAANGVTVQQQHESCSVQQLQIHSLPPGITLPDHQHHAQLHDCMPKQHFQYVLQETSSLRQRHRHHQQQRQQIQQPQLDQQQLHWQHQARLQQQQATAWLSSQIAAAASWQEVGQLLQANESSSSFTPRHVVQLLLRLEQLVLQQQQQQHSDAALAHPVLRHEQAEYTALVHILLRRAAAELNSLRASEVACLLAAAARLPLVSIPKPWSVKVMTRAHHLMSDFSPTGLAVITWALSRLDLRLRADFEQKLLQAFKEKAGSATPRALSLMTHGLVVLRVRPDGMWLGVFVDRVQRSLAGFSGWDLSMCLWGLVRLRCPAPRSLLTAALSLLIRRMPDCTHNDAVVSVWALGRLGHRFLMNSSIGEESTACSAASAAAGGSSRSSSKYSSSRGRSDRSNNSGRRTRKANTKQQQQHRSRRPSQQQQLLLALHQRLQQGTMSAQCITTMLYGLALLHCNPAKDWQTTALSAVHRGLGDLDGQGLSNLLYAVGLLKWQPSRQWQQSFWNALVAQVQRVQPHTRQQQRQRQQRRHRGPSFDAISSSWGSRGAGSGVVRLQQRQYHQQPGLSSQSWEQLHEAQRMLGWRLPLQQLQHLQEQQQLHRISQAQLGSWALQVQQHMDQHHQRQRVNEQHMGYHEQSL